MRLGLIAGRLVLVYQMPKTGSQTVERTLTESPLRCRVCRTHYLSETNAAHLRRLSESTDDPRWRKEAAEQLETFRRLTQALRIRRFLRVCGVPLPRVEVISAVRDVLGAALSTVFENSVLHVPKPELLTPEKCRDLLCRAKPICAEFQEWFDLELEQPMEVDVYSKPFPWEQGYEVYVSRFARVLVYRFDCLPRLPGILSRFLRARIGQLTCWNLSDSKFYSEQYRKIKASLRLPREFVVEQFEGKLMRHFYSAQERAELAEKWSEPERGTDGRMQLLRRVNARPNDSSHGSWTR
jgi:Putative capsular polysaccharide synthesis protein